MKKYIFLLFLVSCVSTNPDHDFASVTNSRNETLEISPIVLPMVVVSKEFKNQNTLRATVDEINRSFDWRMFYTDIDNNHHFITSQKIIYGTVLLDSLEDEYDWDYINGRSEKSVSKIMMGINVYGEIQFAKVYIIDSVYRDRDRLRSYLMHNLLMVLGLDIDGNSRDLNSCLETPPSKNCVITDSDIDIVKRRLVNFSD